eukprot:gene2440-5380_t
MSDTEPAPLPSILKHRDDDTNSDETQKASLESDDKPSKIVSFDVSVHEHSKHLPKPLETGANALGELADGNLLIKLRGKKTFERFYYFDPQIEAISWFSRKGKGNNIKSISILSISSVRAGKSSRGFAVVDTSGFGDQQCFTINHKAGSLDLIAPNEDIRNLWIIGLNYALVGYWAGVLKSEAKYDLPTVKENALIQLSQANLLKKAHNKLSIVRQRRKNWIKSILQEHAEQLGISGKLPLSSVKSAFHDLMPYIQMPFLDRKIDIIRKRFLSSHDGACDDDNIFVTFDELTDHFRTMNTRREIFRLHQMYSSDTEALSTDDLQLLLEAEQQALGLVENKCVQLIQQYEKIPYNKDHSMLGLDGLDALFRNKFTLSKSTLHQSQDDSQPLTSYFIYSSHNTYLQSSQIKGACIADRYRDDLLRGARLIEMDVWPGAAVESSEKMVVYHGYTKATYCLIDDVLQTINENAFMQNSFPVILLIEMHLREADDQALLADKLKQTFGEKLLLPSDELVNMEESNLLPSPRQLQNRILLCSQRAPFHILKESRNFDVIPHDEYAFYATVVKKKRKSKASISEADTNSLTISPAWSNVVALNHRSVTSDFESCVATAEPWTLTSISEVDALKSFENGMAASLFRLSQLQLVRMYPASHRVDSTNYIPTQFWTSGVQCTSLNQQTQDHGYFINNTFFLIFGGTGYALKPPYLLDTTTTYTPTVASENHDSSLGVPRHVQICILSGQQLQLPHASDADSPIIDPYVHLQVLGHASDDANYTTQALDNCSLVAYWNEHCSFAVSYPSLAHLQILVLDDDIVHENFIGQALLPLSLLRTGYWHIQLCDKIGDDIPGSTLFFKVEIDELKPNSIVQNSTTQVQSRASPSSSTDNITPKPRADANTPRQFILKHQPNVIVILNSPLSFFPSSRTSLNQAVLSSLGNELTMTGNDEFDLLFHECNAILSELSSTQTRIDELSKGLLQVLQCKANASLSDAANLLMSQLKTTKFILREEGEAVTVHVPSDQEESPSTQQALKNLQELTIACNEYVRKSDTLGQAVFEKEDALRSALAKAVSDEAILSIVQENCAVFRAAPGKAALTAAAIQEAIFSIKNSLLKARRASLICDGAASL